MLTKISHCIYGKQCALYLPLAFIKYILGGEKNPPKGPQMMKERGKYNERGVFGNAVFNRLNLPKDISDILKSTANMAISNETKKKYNTA